MGLVSIEWLRAHAADSSVRVCDVRWYLPSAGKSGRAEYLAGHLPGAVFVDLDRELAAPDDGTAGRHPLPSREVFEAAMRKAGISADTHVVAYDDTGGSTAARLWWLLKANGHAQVSLLDGGIAAWKAAGLPLETGEVAVRAGTFTARPQDGLARDLEATRQSVRQGVPLLDARAAPRYQGQTEPVDPRPGHIPGARNLPFADLLENGRFRASDAIRARFRDAGVERGPVIASCGSGVTACHLLFALEHAGIVPLGQALLYPGSYSEWSRRRELPVTTGEKPGEPA